MEPKTYSTPEELPSTNPQELELQAAAMRVKLEQNRLAQQQQGIQSVADRLRQMQTQQT
jgi:hypothetical protein